MSNRNAVRPSQHRRGGYEDRKTPAKKRDNQSAVENQ
jgi:hypothetical protein